MSTSTEVPLSQLPVFLNGVARDVLQGDYTSALRRVAVAANAETKERFETQTAPDGTRWPPIKGFRVRYGNGNFQALQDKGILKASATSSQAPGHVELITSLSMETGTNIDYAETHQVGKTIFPKHGRALAIPMTIEAYRHGSPRTPTPFPIALRLVWPKGKAFGWLVEDRKGRGKSDKGAKSITHYMLKPKVVIPKREFIGWSEHLLQVTDEILGDRMAELVGA